MLVRIRDILNARESFIQLSNKQLPIKIAYTLSKIIKKINDELLSFNDHKNTIIRKYVPDVQYKPNTNHTIPKHLENIIFSEVNELLDCEVDLAIEPIDLKELNIDMSVKDLIVLEKFCIYTDSNDNNTQSKDGVLLL